MTISLPHDLGDYTLNKAFDSTAGRPTYLAEQMGTGRHVILELVEEENSSPQDIAEFFEEVRAKTKLSEQLPFLGTVYEAQRKNGFIFFACQYVGGTPLTDYLAEHQTLSSETLLSILDLFSRMYETMEQLGIVSVPPTLQDIKIDADEKIAINNIATAGTPGPEFPAETLNRAGILLQPLISYGTPGATRIHTLLNWMITGNADGQPISWNQVNQLVQSVRQQLGIARAQETQPLLPTLRRLKKLIIPGSIAAGIILLFVLLVVFAPKNDTAPPVDTRPPLSFRDHTSISVILPGSESPLYCDAHEVTIKAYARFLESLENMPEEARMKAFAHPSQPASKTSYAPKDWPAIIDAAKKGEIWQELQLSMTSPVFNVDWWDAYAYAKWKNRRLPTKEEWLAIASAIKTENKGDPYGPVEDYFADISPENLRGFASGLSEWTDTIEKNPEQPMEPAQHVICGGTYKNPSLQQISYEPDGAAANPRTGFRTISSQP